jgi:predicted  nucleic acid-binding Zn-ribbon protein
MKLRILSLSALLLLCALPPACKSPEGHDRAAATADQVVALGGVAGQTQLHLDKTLEGLAQIEATKSQDPLPAFKAFSGAFNSFKSEFAALSEERAALTVKAESWFTEYEARNKAIQDEDLRKTGTKRLAEFREQVADTSKQVDKLIEGTSSVQTRLEDLRTYLGNDLTPDGISAVSGRISDVTKDGRKVAARLGDLSKASEELASRMRAARQKAAESK